MFRDARALSKARPSRSQGGSQRREAQTPSSEAGSAGGCATFAGSAGNCAPRTLHARLLRGHQAVPSVASRAGGRRTRDTCSAVGRAAGAVCEPRVSSQVSEGGTARGVSTHTEWRGMECEGPAVQAAAVAMQPIASGGCAACALPAPPIPLPASRRDAGPPGTQVPFAVRLKPVAHDMHDAPLHAAQLVTLQPGDGPVGRV